MSNNELDDLNDYLSILNPNTRKRLTIVSKEDLKQDFMLRLDVKVPKYFAPYMPMSASSNPKLEDRTIPRVSVAPDILSCILGLAVTDINFFDLDRDIREYTISGIPFDYAVKPDSKLLYDVELTNEHWLLGYNRNTYRYTPFEIGKLMIVSVSRSFKDSTGVRRGLFLSEVNIEITIDQPVQLDTGVYKKRGYYRMTFERNNNVPAQIENLPKREFDKMKRLVLGLESHSLINKW